MKTMKGFSLIELLIVIMMIGIIAAVVVPSASGWRLRSRLNDGTRQIKSALMLAKITAVKQASPILVEFQTGTGGNGSYCVFRDDGGGDAGNASNGVYDNGETIYKQGAMPKDISIYDIDFTVAIAANNKRSAYFNTRGLPFGVNAGQPVYYSGEVYIRSVDSFRRVNVSAGGTITIEKSTVAEGGTWSE